MLFSWYKSLVVLSNGIRDSFVTYAAIMIDFKNFIFKYFDDCNNLFLTRNVNSCVLSLWSF